MLASFFSTNTETSGVCFRKILSEERAPEATRNQSCNCNHNDCSTKTNENLYWNSSLTHSCKVPIPSPLLVTSL